MEFVNTADMDGKPEGGTKGDLRINFGGDNVGVGKVGAFFEPFVLNQR